MLGGRYGFREEVEHGTRMSFAPRPPIGAKGREATAAVDAELQRGAAMNEALAQAKIALSEAGDHSLSFELFREHAYLVGLAKHQAGYMRAAYLTLYGSMAVWRFATLPLRPGWVVRNTLDNVAKAMIAGTHDPRYFMHGGAGRPGESVFNANVKALREVAYFSMTCSAGRRRGRRSTRSRPASGTWKPRLSTASSPLTGWSRFPSRCWTRLACSSETPGG